MDNIAMKTIVAFFAGQCKAGAAPHVFDCEPDHRGCLSLSFGGKPAPKVHMALQFVIKTYFRIENVIAARLAKSACRLGPFNKAG